jgi:hypothetical protein
MRITRHSGLWTLEDRFGSRWQYLPVDVPDGACGLRAELAFDRSAAILDLGCFSPNGFRGWSGGARESFVISKDAATPGYLPGELDPGTWHVVIGLHQIPADGAEYRLTAEVSTTPGELEPEPPPGSLSPVTDRMARRELPASAGRHWLAGDLHTHTVHSDGSMSVPELARFAAGRGLDFIAITDHNTVSHHAELPATAREHGIILLPGQEVTVEEGHAGALGDIGWIDFREPADAWLEATERAGGLLSVNHPYGGHVSWTIPMKRRPPLAEIWHWSWLDLHWTAPLAWWLAWDPTVIPVGGSDYHSPGGIDAPPGKPTTWVQCADGGAASDGPAAVLDGLRAGLTAISAERDGPVLLRVDGELIAAGAEGMILVGPDGPVAKVTSPLASFAGGAGCHRLADPTGATLALTL